MYNFKLEIACFNLKSALSAHENMADRVELCRNLSVGGLTPEIATVISARTKLSIDLFIMIRPREGNFVYSNDEFKQMKKDIKSFKEIGVDGFVFGILNDDGGVNKKQNKELIKLAEPLPCTFHRAFDDTTNPFKALEDIIDCGFTTILTSGQKPTAMEGINMLQKLVERADNRINIMPGGGVRSANIDILMEKLKVPYYHSSAIIDNGDFPNVKEMQLIRKKLQTK